MSKSTSCGVNKPVTIIHETLDLHQAYLCHVDMRWGVKVGLYLWAAAGTEGFSAPVLKGSVSEPGWHILGSSEPKGGEKAVKVMIWWLWRVVYESTSWKWVCIQMWVISEVKKEKGDILYLKLPDDGGQRRVFPTLFVQQSHVVVKLTDVCGVHL